MPHDFSLSSATLPSGRVAHYAQRSGSTEPKFVIGYRTMYQGNFGLFNVTLDPSLAYDPAAYSGKYGFWAHFIYPTAKAESKGSFYCLNTYDRARFTFSFMQYAIHVPNGDFVKFFKKLLALPAASDYFPKLVLKDKRIFYKKDTGELSQLENDTTTQGLMNYFNPSLADIENQELICSARMVHWAMNDPEHRRIQAETAIEHFMANMKEYDKRFNLNNVPAKVCLVICDIRHQGRATNDRIAAALNTNGDYEKAYKNLLIIGDTNYSERINTVKTTIASLITQGLFNKKYKSADNSFVNL